MARATLQPHLTWYFCATTVFPKALLFLSQQPEKLCSLHNDEHLSVSTALWQWYLHLTDFLNRAERHFDTAGGLGQRGKSGIISTEGTWSNYSK